MSFKDFGCFSDISKNGFFERILKLSLLFDHLFIKQSKVSVGIIVSPLDIAVGTFELRCIIQFYFVFDFVAIVTYR